ncbi:MAG: tetratricopeptide repeat protein [Sphingomonas sp.]|nr:tetratricopeptide repeat protein [Sphingomonas sp.]
MNGLDGVDFPAMRRLRTASDSSLGRFKQVVRPGLPLAGLLLPALIFLSACKDREQQAAELAQQADLYAQAGNIVGAREAIRQAILLREDDPQFHRLQGAIALRANDPVGAFRSFSTALEFDATDKVSLAYVANIGVQIGQIDQADEAADRLLTLEPDARPALQVKGLVAMTRRKYEEAAQYADRLLASDPTDEGGAIIKARSLALTGQPEAGLKLIEEALKAAPESAALLANKVNLYRYLRQPEPMADALAALVRQPGGSPSLKLDQVNLLYKLGRKEAARRTAVTFLEDGTRNPDDYRKMLGLWWQYDRAPIADAQARDASKWQDPIALVQTIRFLLLNGEKAAAEAMVASAPASARDLLGGLKARLLFAQGRESEARAQVDALLKKDENDVDALLLRSRFALADRKLGVALEAAQLARTNDPLNPETYTVLAGIYRAQGNELRARQIFEEGLKSVPQNFYILEAYTQYLHQLGDTGRAVSAARSFARDLPSSERAWSFLRTQCERAGDAGCLQTATTGLENAKTSYLVDDLPGTPADRGLFGRL